MEPEAPAEPHGESSRLELALYWAAAIAYIALGFVRQEIFAWWIYGAIWIVAAIWFGPPTIRRLRARRGVSGTSTKRDTR